MKIEPGAILSQAKNIIKLQKSEAVHENKKDGKATDVNESLITQFRQYQSRLFNAQSELAVSQTLKEGLSIFNYTFNELDFNEKLSSVWIKISNLATRWDPDNADGLLSLIRAQFDKIEENNDASILDFKRNIQNQLTKLDNDISRQQSEINKLLVSRENLQATAIIPQSEIRKTIEEMQVNGIDLNKMIIPPDGAKIQDLLNEN